MSMQVLAKSLEEGIYPQHYLQQRYPDSGQKMPALKAFELHAEKQGIAPDDEELKAAETYWLNELRVQEHETRRAQKVKAFARQHWQLEAIFEDEKLPLRGPEAGLAEKAFSVTSTQAIFPIFYDTQIMAGILAQPLLDLLIMDTITANVGTFDHVSLNEIQSDRQFGEAGEYTTFKELSISATNAPLATHKFGGLLQASDEALRRTRVPIYAYGIRRIGQQLGIDLTDFAIDVILNGDGTAGAATATASGVSHAATYTDWTSLLYSPPIGYEMTDYIASKNVLSRLSLLPQVQDPLAGFMLQRTGGMPALFGINPHRWDSTGSTTYSNSGALDVVVMFQRNLALIQYQEGGLVTETEREINGEFTQTKTSLYTTFGVWDPSARVQGTGF